MSVPSRRIKILLAAPVVLLLWWVVLRRPPTTVHTTCNQLFHDVHKYIVDNAFDYREELFIGVWASTNTLEKQSCSYYSIHRSKSYMLMGYRKPPGESLNQYVEFTKDKDGVISYYSEDDPTNILGYIYPLYFDKSGPGLGSVECVDKHGYAEWKATIAITMDKIDHPMTYSVIRQGIRQFQKLSPQLNVNIHLGDYYNQVCWQTPTWHQDKYPLTNNTA